MPRTAIYAIHPDGTGLVRLVEGVTYRSTPAWSPDGSKIAFDRPDGLYVMQADGSDVQRLVACAAGCQGIGDPAWAPGGDEIAFPSTRDGRDGLWVVGANGGDFTSVRESVTILGSPAWSTDGREIAVSGYLGDMAGENAILVISVATGEVVTTISVPGIEFAETVAWSPNGRWLVASATGEAGSSVGAGIYMIRPDGTDVRLLTSCPSPPDCIDVYPAWSPDGEAIVFTRGICTETSSDCFTGDLYLVYVKGGRPTQLTSGSGLDCCPSWQPITASESSSFRSISPSATVDDFGYGRIPTVQTQCPAGPLETSPDTKTEVSTAAQQLLLAANSRKPDAKAIWKLFDDSLKQAFGSFDGFEQAVREVALEPDWTDWRFDGVSIPKLPSDAIRWLREKCGGLKADDALWQVDVFWPRAQGLAAGVAHLYFVGTLDGPRFWLAL